MRQATTQTAVAMMLTALLLGGCGSSSAPTVSASASAPIVPTQPVNLDRSCDLAPFPSALWTQCENANFAKTGESNQEQLGNAEFLQRMNEQSTFNVQSWLARAQADPSWLDPRSGNTAVLPLCNTGALNCVADPFRWPDAAGADGKSFYESEAEVTPVVYYDQDCARISGRVWRPRNLPAGAQLPGIVIEVGSFQAPEQAYWWAVQALVRAGYQVMTSDVRGQGRSDFMTPSGQLGSNANGIVFLTDFVNAIDFFHSTPRQPYPHNQRCAGSYPTPVTAYNPHYATLDHARLGVAGHSGGAVGASFMQAYDAPGGTPWPGLLDTHNPVDVTVAWDALSYPGKNCDVVLNNVDAETSMGCGILNALVQNEPVMAARKPALNFKSEYALAPTPFVTAPDPEAFKHAYRAWSGAGVPIFSITVQGSTHYEWSLIPNFPSTSWCPEIKDGACTGGWALPMSVHYTVAWFDRWLKNPGEPGYADADQRLVDDGGPEGAIKMSWHFRSARDYPDRSGKRQYCEDIRAGCK